MAIRCEKFPILKRVANEGERDGRARDMCSLTGK